MNQQNTQPLYKVLDSERTQGIQVAVYGSDNIPKLTSSGYFVAEFRDSKDAQYTALAVNNLANVADALQKAIDHEKDKWEICLIMNEEYIAPDWLDKAKEALKAIS